MAKNLKLNIKNTQIAKALNLDSVKEKLASKKAGAKKESTPKEAKGKAKKVTVEETAEVATTPEEEIEETKPRKKARSKSVFAAPVKIPESDVESDVESESLKSNEMEEPLPVEEAIETEPEAEIHEIAEEAAPIEEVKPTVQQTPPATPKLGPTGKHIKDLFPKKKEKAPAKDTAEKQDKKHPSKKQGEKRPDKQVTQVSQKDIDDIQKEIGKKSGRGGPKVKEFRDLKPSRQKGNQMRSFDSRDRQGLRVEEERTWRKKKKSLKHSLSEELTIRPSSLSIRVPIRIKDLASEMKLKASELIGKLFLQGIIVTLNDTLDDETTIQLLGHEFGCEITIDTSEEERIRITDQSIRDEIKASELDELISRAPIVTFMGHVDHGKTSLIDAIRKSNITSGEAGAITQHIGAFRCQSKIGEITVLDTPGHEAFTAMRARGADVTDIVVLVVAGDEGMRQQTIEAIEHARSAGVTILVAINKCDKPNFNVENVYRQLSENELLPEAWGGQTITVNCSAVSGEGVNELLEMLALQSELLELKANPNSRARGTVLESEMHKGLGSVATILIQNGTLRHGDAIVVDNYWGRIKTMKDEHGNDLKEAGPSTPVEITGISGLPEAGQEFVVVSNEKEARDIAETRHEDARLQQLAKLKKAFSMESLAQQAQEASKKTYHVIVRADVQGSLEALVAALEKIKSKKIQIDIISSSVGEITESDVQLAASSQAIILGFHTGIESHAESLIKQYGIKIRLHDIIYHAIDDIKELMRQKLDKIQKETDKGKAEVRQVFKSSHLGTIAGCYVTEGTILRNHHIRLIREGEVIWKGPISSIRRVKEDAKEVQKGLECGILLHNFTDLAEGDILQAYEISYIEPEL